MLELTEPQVAQYKAEISGIIDYVEQLQDVDVEGLEPTLQVTGLTNVTRSDEIQQQVSQAELMKNAPATENNHIKVERVLN